MLVIEARGERREVLRRYIDPKADPAFRRWNDIEVDLSPYAGEDVRFSLLTGAGPKGDAQYDWAVWGDRRIQSS